MTDDFINNFNRDFKNKKSRKKDQKKDQSIDDLIIDFIDINDPYDYKPFENIIKKTRNFNKIINFKFIGFAIALIFIYKWVLTGEHNNTTNKTIKAVNNQEKYNQEFLLPDSVSSAAPLDSEELQTSVSISDNSSIISDDITIKKNDNIISILQKLKINNDSINQIITSKKIKEYLSKIKPGEKLHIKFDKDSHDLLSLEYNIDKFNIFIIEQELDANNNSSLTSKLKNLNLIEQQAYTELTINSSLFEDALKQNIPMDLVFQLIDIFAWDIDFAQDLRVNDKVQILYKEYYLNGSLYTTGPILAVNFYNNNQLFSAIRYEHNNQADYYTPDGLSLRKAFIRSPVKFTRISSKFTLGRKHPILHRIRAHRGVDYAAPTGTPIKAAGDGKLIHYGRKGGYGKAAVIQHGSKYTTLYAHMSRYAKRLKTGSYVKQGDIIGYVGMTGLATGPHLHYEFRINDKHVNPLTVKLPKAKPIANKLKTEFTRYSKQLFKTIDLQSSSYISKLSTDNSDVQNSVFE